MLSFSHLDFFQKKYVTIYRFKAFSASLLGDKILAM